MKIEDNIIEEIFSNLKKKSNYIKRQKEIEKLLHADAKGSFLIKRGNEPRHKQDARSRDANTTQHDDRGE